MDNRHNDIKHKERRDNRDINRSEFNKHDRRREKVVEDSHDRSDYKRSEENRRLRFMHDLDDYKVVSEDPDVRGWEVVDINNRRVGKIDDLLVDMRREKVRYLDVDLDQEIISSEHDPFDNNNASGVHEYTRDGDIHMIVPVGLARIDESNKRVISDEINRSILEGGHVHRKGDEISPEHERKVLDTLRLKEGRNTRETSSTQSMRNNDYERRSSIEDREMRRPTSNDDTDLSKAADEQREAYERGYYDRDREMRNESNRNMRGQSTDVRSHRIEGRTERRAMHDPQTQGPFNNDNDDFFYDHRYFDDRRFYGRR